MNQVHYLVRPPDKAEGLVYPSDVDLKNYYGFGGFYLLGKEDSMPEDEYCFLAIYRRRLIVTVARRYRDFKGFFRVDVKKVGRFMFYAQSMPKKHPYSGASPLLQGYFAFCRMRSWMPTALDQACLEHDFYFVGSSPRTQ